VDYTERGLFHYRNKDFLTITTWLTSLGQQNREPKERRREPQGGQMKGTRAAATRPGRARGPRGAAQHLGHAGLRQAGQNQPSRAEEPRCHPAGPFCGFSRLPQQHPSPYRPPWRGGTSHPTPPAASRRARRPGGRVRACLATGGGRGPASVAPRGVVGTGMAVLRGAGAPCARLGRGGGGRRSSLSWVSSGGLRARRGVGSVLLRVVLFAVDLL